MPTGSVFAKTKKACRVVTWSDCSETFQKISGETCEVQLFYQNLKTETDIPGYFKKPLYV